MKVQSFKELIAWQKATEIAVKIYQLTKDFPKEEIYGLRAQIRRAAVSIPSNIAEGQGRSSTGEFRLFLGHAYGSLCEVETQLIIAQKLAYISEKSHAEICRDLSELGKLINGLLRSIAPITEH